ncbi:MAG: RNA polymerase sporulation sigma factor SigH [Lachnoclostridium sp.]|nr:RNA polymerase sporulation sigma factor SigH [Lachnoclostridium sp.]
MRKRFGVEKQIKGKAWLSDLKEEYQQHSDEELMMYLQDGETGIIDFIMNKYKNLVKSKAKSMYILGADKDDLIQEGMIGLFKAVRDYDSGRDASFFTFADLCISRQMYTAVQASRRQKHIPLNTYISLYATARENAGESEEDMALVNILSLKSEQSPEDMLIDKENVEQLEKTIEKELSGFEKQVLDLYLTGMRYTQIAKVLGRDEKSTDNALQRIKSKLKKAIRQDAY